MCQDFNLYITFTSSHTHISTYLTVCLCVFYVKSCHISLPTYIASLLFVLQNHFPTTNINLFDHFFHQHENDHFHSPLFVIISLFNIYLYIFRRISTSEKVQRHVSGEMEEGGELGGGFPRRQKPRGRGIAGPASGAGGRVLGRLPVPEMPAESG